MQKIKKTVSILLSFILIFSVFTIIPFTASAAVVSDADFSVGAGGSLYTINNDAGWRTFCDMVNSGESFSGMTVMLNGNIGTAANPVTASAAVDSAVSIENSGGKITLEKGEIFGIVFPTHFWEMPAIMRGLLREGEKSTRLNNTRRF